MMWKALVLIVAIALKISSADAYNTAWSFEDPVESLQGTYDVVSMKIADNPPMLASLWEFEGDFNIVAWPPRYCHAIHVCFVPSKMRSAGHFHIEKDLCSKQSIKWYPHISEVQVKVEDAGEYEKKYNQMNSLRFEDQKDSKYSIHLTDEAYDRNVEFTARKINNVKIDLKEKMALLLTNSRFCFAHVAQAHKTNSYYSLLAPTKYKDQTALPTVLVSHDEPEGHSSIFKPYMPSDHPKTVDLLHHIKSLKKLDVTKMRQTPTCSSFRTKSTNKLKKSIGVVAADSWLANIQSAQAPKRNDAFYVYIGAQCSWLRLWIHSDAAVTMDDYMTGAKFDIADTIDLFFDQQFMVPADSDEARPLFGNSSQIGIIMLRRHRPKSSASNEKLVELAYGRDRGPGLPFIEYFHMPSYHAAGSFKVTLIKAPNCEATLVPGSQHMRTGSATPPETNIMNFKKCEHTLYNDKGNN